MPQYLITYVGSPSHPSTPEEGQAHMAKYKEWLSSLGDAAVSPMNPLKNTQTVSSDGSVSDGGISSMSGYTIIAASSQNAAIEIAQACPYLNIGGSLEVSELVVMS